MGQHFGLAAELVLIFHIIHLGVSGGDDQDTAAVLEQEGQRLGDAGRFDAHGLGRQLHSGGGHVKLPDAVRDAQRLHIRSDFLNRHDWFLLSAVSSHRTSTRSTAVHSPVSLSSVKMQPWALQGPSAKR